MADEGLEADAPYIIKVCGVGEQGSKLVSESIPGSDVIYASDELQGIDVLFIVSEMENDMCRKQTQSLARKVMKAGALTLALCPTFSASMEKLQQQVDAIILLADDEWQGMPTISVRYAFIVQRMKLACLGIFHCQIEGLRDFFGERQVCLVSYRMVCNQAEFDEGSGLLPAYSPEQWGNIGRLFLFLGNKESLPISQMTMAASRFYAAWDGSDDTEMWFTLSENRNPDCYLDALFFTR
jgi:hypothetical protein